MHDKKMIDLTYLIELKPEGHFGWVNDMQFQGDAAASDLRLTRKNLEDRANAARRSARLLGDTLIDMLNTDEFRDKNRRIKIKVASPEERPLPTIGDAAYDLHVRERVSSALGHSGKVPVGWDDLIGQIERLWQFARGDMAQQPTTKTTKTITGTDGKEHEVPVPGKPPVPRNLAADEMTPLQAQKLFDELVANGDKLHRILELVLHRPTNDGLDAALTQLNQKIDGHTDRKIEELDRRLENWNLILRADVLAAISEYAAGEQPEATPLPINTTMSGKGVFWYNASTHTICEGAARPAGAGWARLVPAPESMESPPHTSDEAWRNLKAAQAKETLEGQIGELKKATRAAAAEAKVPPSAMPGPGEVHVQGMPKDVNDRINRNVKRQATVRRTLSVPVETPADPAAVEKALTMGVGLSQINLNSLREDHEQLLRYLQRDIEKIGAPITDGATLVLAKGMLDNASRFAATLNRWKEAVDHLGKHAAEIASESGALRKELGL